MEALTPDGAKHGPPTSAKAALITVVTIQVPISDVATDAALDDATDVELLAVHERAT
jgi:hypothetical protein